MPPRAWVSMIRRAASSSGIVLPEGQFMITWNRDPNIPLEEPRYAVATREIDPLGQFMIHMPPVSLLHGTSMEDLLTCEPGLQSFREDPSTNLELCCIYVGNYNNLIC